MSIFEENLDFLGKNCIVFKRNGKNCFFRILLKTNNIDLVKQFYSQTFDWSFKDYGPDYTSFSNSALNGGFEKTDENIQNLALVVLYHEDLPYIKDLIIKNGGKITRDIFSFPGGSRFHFIDPIGNELAVWSDK